MSGHSNHSLDVTGVVLNVISIAFGLYIPYFFTIFLIHTGMDPLSQFKQFITPDIPRLSNIFTIIRPISTVISFLQIFRFFSIIFCGVCIGVNLLLCNISWMEGNSHKFWVKSYSRVILHNHACLQIMYQSAAVGLNTMMAIMMFAGLLLNVPFNYVTLKMYNHIPLRLYLVFPSVSILIPTVIQLMMPLLVNVYEAEVVLHLKLRRALWLSRDLKELWRRLKGTKALGVDAGVGQTIFYSLRRNTKATYGWTIVNYTVSALLSENG